MTATITPCRDAVERVISVGMPEDIELAKGNTPEALLARFRIAAMVPMMRLVADELDRGTDRSSLDLTAANFLASLSASLAGLTRSKSRSDVDRDGANLLIYAYRVLTDPRWREAVEGSPSERVMIADGGEPQ